VLGQAIAITNGKGGVGKTSLAANLGGLFASAGYRVLLVDMDPQGNLGRDLGYIGTDRSDDGASLFTAIAGGTAVSVLRNVRERLDVVCGGSRLDDLASVMLGRQANPRANSALHHALAPISDDYDLIFIDCPPGVRVFQVLALSAARYVLVPTRVDEGSFDGLEKVADVFQMVREASNPDLTFLGVVLFGVGQSERLILRRAAKVVADDLGDYRLILRGTVRHALKPAQLVRERGWLMYELEREQPGLRSSAGTAGDYQALAAQVGKRLTRHMQGSDVFDPDTFMDGLAPEEVEYA
jgi:chromosome partitioning protein